MGLIALLWALATLSAYMIGCGIVLLVIRLRSRPKPRYRYQQVAEKGGKL